jgi:hypothetical protein
VCGELVGILTSSISILIYVWQDEKRELTTHRFATARLGYGAGAATAEAAKEARRMEDSNFMFVVLLRGSGEKVEDCPAVRSDRGIV